MCNEYFEKCLVCIKNVDGILKNRSTCSKQILKKEQKKKIEKSNYSKRSEKVNARKAPSRIHPRNR